MITVTARRQASQEGRREKDEGGTENPDDREKPRLIRRSLHLRRGPEKPGDRQSAEADEDLDHSVETEGTDSGHGDLGQGRGEPGGEAGNSECKASPDECQSSGKA